MSAAQLQHKLPHQTGSPPPADHNAMCMVVAEGEIKASAHQRAIAWQPRGLLGIDDGAAFWLYLGTSGGYPRYAAIVIGEARRAEAAPFRPPRQEGFLSLHQLNRAAPWERQYAARALHMSAWLHRSQYCGTCGASMLFDTLLNKRTCTNQACGHQVYARIEPAIITLVTDGNACLLARQASFPKGFYAPIAGFIEPGETPEQAVAREVSEETGQAVQATTYVSAQPWPYPGSLMLGFIATVTCARALSLSAELEHALWLERDALTAALEQPGQSLLLLPPRGVIGHTLLQHWVAQGMKTNPGIMQ